MRRSLVGAAIFTLSAFAPVSQGKADLLPTEIGACSETTISDIGYLLGDPDSGSAISYANGGAQVSYDTIPEIHHSRVGDVPARVGKRPTRSIPAAELKC